VVQSNTIEEFSQGEYLSPASLPRAVGSSGPGAIMSDRSGIEWTGDTWNPVTGCDRVSEGCDHC
jgi:hypothetical protein